MSNGKPGEVISYFVITSREDGIDVQEGDEGIVRQYIEPDEDGCFYAGKPEILDHVPEIIDGFFANTGNTMDERTPIIIIKGKIIVPKPKQTVTEYEIE